MAFIGKESVTVTSLDSAESMSVVTDLTVDTNTLKVDSVSNRVGILNAAPSVSLDIGSATDAIHIPVGTTGERPGAPTSGLFRYNTSLNQFEGYTSTWGAIGGGGTNTFTHDSFTGDNSTTDFVLSQATESENNLFVFIDGVFQTQDAYSIATNSGITTLTLSAAPVLNRKIIVYTVAAGVSGNNLNQNLFDANTSDAVDGVNDTFTLSIPPVNKNNTQVFFDGVYQHKANYSVSGTSLTFTDAPPLGVVVEVMIFTQTAVNVPVDNSVTSSKLSGDLVAPGNLTVTGYLAGPSTFILDPSAVGDNTGTLLVKGNLQVDGIQTIINSTTLTVDDLNITLASGAANALAADGAGITIDTGSDPDATITYDGVNDRWNFNKNVDVTGTVTADGLIVDGDTVTANAQNAVTMEFNSATGIISADRTGGNYADLSLRTTAGSTPLERLRISYDGNLSLYEDTGTTPKFFWDASAESLGIGTSAPVTALDVRGEISVDYNATYGLRFYNEDRNNWSSIGNTIATGNTSANLVFKTSVGEAMRIDSSGHVIVKNGGRFYLESSSGFSPFLSESSNDLLFTVNNGERLRIDASGRVGIGGVPNTNWRNDLANQEILMLGTEATLFSDGGVTTELWNNAYIDNTDTIFNISTRGASRYQQYQGAHKWWTAASASAGSDINTELGTTPKMTLDVNGDLILGSTASLSGATITTVSSGNTHNAMRNSAATAGKFWRQEVDNANIFYIINDASTGVYMNDGGTTWVAISDETVKENIVEIEGALDKVMGYRCVEYNLIADENKAKKIGFIAQDWEVDYSPVVVTGADGKLGMQYTETIPVLLKAIQEQQATIEALTARIAALES